MTRKIKCIRTHELGHVVLTAMELCRYAMKPLTETVCNDDIPCDRKSVLRKSFVCISRKNKISRMLS